MGLFNKYFSSGQGQRRDYEFYIGLCFEVQTNFLKDTIFTDPPSFIAQSDQDFLPLEEYNKKTIKSFEKLVLNTILLAISIKKTFGHACKIDDLWKKEDEGLKRIINRIAYIMIKNPLFLTKAKEYNGFEPSEPMVAGLLYIQGRFYDYGEDLDWYFDNDFDASEVDYEDDETDHSLEARKTRLIRAVYRSFAQPFIKYPPRGAFIEIDIDEWEKIVDGFEKMINDAYNYLSDKLSTGRF
jgi:hypothetical protein